MRNTILFLFFFCCVPIVLGQTESSTLFSDCFGALEVSAPGKFQLALTGTPGIYDDLSRFSRDLSRKEENSLWLRIEIAHSGSGLIRFQHLNQSADIIIFRNENTDCNRILEGKARTERITRMDNLPFEFLLENVKKGEVFLIGVNTSRAVKEVALEYTFQIFEEELDLSSAIRLLDRRKDPTEEHLLLKVRNGLTGEPVNAQIVIRELNRLNALYNATDIILPKQRTLSFGLSVDAQGFFPFDSEIKSTGTGSDTIIVHLTTVEPGRRIEIEGIEFQPQSNQLLPNSETRLLRLRDFLVFNPDVRIEIQGHVHHFGNNNFSSRRLSSRRATSVKKYLIRNGIDKKRLVAKGYGNTQMKFPEAANRVEEQANRRVEIRIIE